MAAQRSRWLAGLLLALLVAAAACGGDDEEPGAAASPVPTPAQAAPSPEPTPTPEGETYVVESGDTLGSIALRFDTTVDAIVDANSLEDPDALSIGDELLIPPPAADPEPDDGSTPEAADAPTEEPTER